MVLVSHKPTLGTKVFGRVKSVEVVESRRLHTLRKKFFCLVGDTHGFMATHGVPFDGSYAHFNTLSVYTRERINRLLVQDIKDHPQEWERQKHDVVCSVETRDEKPNLILNQGYDFLLNYQGVPTSVASCCVVGTGTNTPAATDVSLQTEVKRTNTYLTGSGNCGTTTGSTATTRSYTYRRTFDFSIETVSRNYTELGFSYTLTAGNNLFSRLLISGGTVTVGIGQSLRVVYDLTFVINVEKVAGSFNMGEWGVVNVEWCPINANFPVIDTNGANNSSVRSIYCPRIGGTDYTSINGYAVTGDFSFSYGSLSGATIVSSSIAVNDETSQWSTYVAGSRTRSISWTNYWSAASFSSSALRGFLYGMFDSNLNFYNAFAIKFSANQTKTNLQKLMINGLRITYS